MDVVVLLLRAKALVNLAQQVTVTCSQRSDTQGTRSAPWTDKHPAGSGLTCLPSLRTRPMLLERRIALSQRVTANKTIQQHNSFFCIY